MRRLESSLHNQPLKNQADSLSLVTRDVNTNEHSSQSEVRLPADNQKQPNSSQVETIVVESEKISEDPQLDETMLQILGEDPNKDKLQSDNIHRSLANRWIDIIKKGLTQEVRRELLQKYPEPKNLLVVKPPSINPEIKRTMTDAAIKKDKFQAASQQQVGACLSAIGAALADYFKSGNKENTSLVTHLSDAGRLLADIFHNTSATRRAFITPNLNRIVKNIAEELPVDNFFYGENFSERLKAAQTMEKQSKDISKPPPPPPVQKSQYKSKRTFQPRSQPAVSGSNLTANFQPALNSKGPSSKKSHNSSRQGGQNRPYHSQMNRRRY